MTRRVALALAVFVAAFTSRPGAAPASQSTSVYERLRIGAHVYFADARVVSTWRVFTPSGAPGRSSSPDSIHTYRSLCVFMTEPGTPTADAAYGWSFETTPIAQTTDSVTIRVDWQRTRQRGAANLPKGSVVLTLAPGKSVPLDVIAPDPADANAASPCSAVGMMLDVAVWKSAGGPDR